VTIDLTSKSPGFDYALFGVYQDGAQILVHHEITEGDVIVVPTNEGSPPKRFVVATVIRPSEETWAASMRIDQVQAPSL